MGKFRGNLTNNFLIRMVYFKIIEKMTEIYFLVLLTGGFKGEFLALFI